MLVHLAVLLLAAAPGPRVAWASLKVESVSPDVATLVSRVLAVSIERAGVELVKPEPALDCSADPAPCSAEAARRAAVDGFLTGTLSEADGTTTMCVVVLDSSGHPLSRQALPAQQTWALVEQLQALGPKLAAALSASASKPIAQESALHRWSPWLIGAGVGGTAVGAGFLVLAKLNHDHLEDLSRTSLDQVTSTPTDAIQSASAGRREQLVGGILFGVGVAALTTGLLVRILQPGRSPQAPTLGFDPAHRTVVLTGVLP